MDKEKIIRLRMILYKNFMSLQNTGCHFLEICPKDQLELAENILSEYFEMKKEELPF